jgi:hypothetical protein
MIKMPSAVHLDELLKQIDDLKKKLNGASPFPRTEPSGLKVVGTVSAGMLSSASVVPTALVPEVFRMGAVKSAPTPAGFRAAAPPKQFERFVREPSSSSLYATPAVTDSPASESFQAISADEAYACWQQWIAEVQRARISVGAALSVSTILDVDGGALRIACPDDYHLSSLRKNKEFLMESFQKVAGRKVRIEVVLHTKLPTPTSEHSPAAHNTPALPRNGVQKEHPVLEALRRELGIEPVE